MNRTNIFFGESHSDWLPVRGGESGDFVFRRGDGHAFAKIAPASRRGELAGERDRLIWLKGRGVACPEVINWQEEQEGACLVITAIPGVPAADLSGADLLKAWPSMGSNLALFTAYRLINVRLSAGCRECSDAPLMWCPQCRQSRLLTGRGQEYAAARSFG